MESERLLDDAPRIESSMVPKHAEKTGLPSRILRFWPFILLGLFLIVMIVPLFMVPPLIEGRRGPRVPGCCYELKQIGMCLCCYRDHHGTGPLFSSGDDEGNPTPSWRVLLLPFMEKDDLFNEYDSSSPWDSDENLPLLDKIPEVFFCAVDDQRRAGDTNLVAVLGPGTAWSQREGIDLAALKRTAATTAIILEIQNSGIGWTENRDITLAELKQLIRDRGRFPTPHKNGFNVLFADGSVYGIKASIPEETLAELFSPAPKKSLPRKYLCDPF